MVMKFRALILSLAAYIIALGLSSSSFAQTKADTMNKALVKTHATLSKRYNRVSHIDAQALSKMDEDS